MNRLKAKSNTFAMFIILTIIFILFAVYYFFSYRALENVTVRMLMKDSSKTALVASNDIKSRIKLAEAAAQRPEADSAGAGAYEKLSNIKKIIGADNSDQIYILKDDGSVAPGYSDLDKDFSSIDFSSIDFSFIIEAVNNGGTITAQIPSNHPGIYTGLIATGIKPKTKEAAVLVVALEDNWLRSLIRSVPQVGSEFTAVVDKNGNTIGESINGFINTEAHSRIPADIYKKYNSFEHLAVKLRDGVAGNTEYSQGGIRKLAIYTPITNTDWFLLTTIPLSAAFDGVRAVAVVLLVLLFVIFLIVYALFVYSGKLMKNLRRASEKSSAAVSLANLFIIEITSDGVIKSANDYFYKITGYTYEEVINSKFESLLEYENLDLFDSLIQKTALEGYASGFDIPVRKKGGETVFLLWESALSVDSPQGHMELIGVNITDLKEYQNKIHKMAYYDELTNGPNKALLEDTIIDLFDKNQSFAMLLINIDSFKSINVLHGYSVGNKYIKHVYDIISAQSDENHLVFKLSGGEFVVIYVDFKDTAQLAAFAEVLSAAAAKEFFEAGVQIKATCSIGISISYVYATDFDSLHKTAGIALAKAKAAGKGKFMLYEPSMNDELITSITLDLDIKAAVESDEFLLYYQPQYHMQSGNLYGFEALLRWISPTRGFVSPGAFISAAEKNRLIIPIGLWALKEAANFAKEISSMGYEDIIISVNVSVVQITEENFVSSVLNVLNETGVDFKNIKLEITETVLMESLEANLKKINALVDAGIKIALDDFGTGYSSLTYLKRMPIQLLKIDKAFVDTIFDEDENKEIITSIINLAHNIKVDVAAEGVEEKSQVLWLRERGCDLCQGYYSGMPVPKERAVEHLSSNLLSRLDSFY